MKRQQQSLLQWLLPLLLILGSPSLVFANTGMGGINGLWSGFAHPFGGLDHLCEMLGVGVCGRLSAAVGPCGWCRWRLWW
jgi:hydrogenase/urease accessory protein HupE